MVCLQVAQLKASMESIVEQWKAYDEIYAKISLMTTRYLYCIDQCKPSGEEASLEALKKQVKTLQVKLSYFCTSFYAFWQTNSTKKKDRKIYLSNFFCIVMTLKLVEYY